MGFQSYRTYTGYLDVWIVDYVKAARELQLSLYGQTNITVDESTHVSAIDLALGTKNAYSNDYDEEEETTHRYPFSDYTLPSYEWPSYEFPSYERPSYDYSNILRPNRNPEETTVYEEETDFGGEDDTQYDENNGGDESVTEEYEA